MKLDPDVEEAVKDSIEFHRQIIDRLNKFLSTGEFDGEWDADWSPQK